MVPKNSSRDRAWSAILADLEEVVPKGVVGEKRLADIARWRIGGPARVYVEPRNESEVSGVLRVMRNHPVPLFVMGDGSNLLFDSAGFDGVIMRIGHKMSRIEIRGNDVFAQAGVWIPHLARRVGRLGLSGLEHTVGIPGTLGGLVLMNGGSQRKGVGSSVTRVFCVDVSGQPFSLDQRECGFRYRYSELQGASATVVAVGLRLDPENPRTIVQRMINIMQDRRRKFPKNLPNAGSTFLSNPEMYDTVGPPGRLIEEAGLAGAVRGGAEISRVHANFISNIRNASSEDVLWLIELVRRRVFEERGVWLDCEVRHVAPDGRVRPAHQASAELFAGREL